MFASETLRRVWEGVWSIWEMNNCGNRENNFHQFFFVRSEHYIRAITSRGKWGEEGGKKEKKRASDAGGGRRVWGKAQPTESTKFGRCGARKPRKRRHLIGEAYAELPFNQRENINPWRMSCNIPKQRENFFFYPLFFFFQFARKVWGQNYRGIDLLE